MKLQYTYYALYSLILPNFTDNHSLLLSIFIFFNFYKQKSRNTRKKNIPKSHFVGFFKFFISKRSAYNSQINERCEIICKF